MLMIKVNRSRPLLRLIAEIVLPLAILLSLVLPARAEEGLPPLNLLLEPQSESYSYRNAHREKTINLMVYGFKDGSGAPTDEIIPKDKKALNAFFHQHWDRVKRDYLGGNNPDSMRFVAGDDSFTAPVNRGIDVEPAKMVGMTVPIGKLTVGGGYTWGDDNPAYMLKTTDGIMVGAGYDMGRTGFQISYLTSGQEVMGFEIGGNDIRYNSLMFGTSFRVNDRVGLTATVQYRDDSDPLTTGDKQAIFTVGTKWKF